MLCCWLTSGSQSLLLLLQLEVFCHCLASYAAKVLRISYVYQFHQFSMVLGLNYSHISHSAICYVSNTVWENKVFSCRQRKGGLFINLNLEN